MAIARGRTGGNQSAWLLLGQPAAGGMSKQSSVLHLVGSLQDMAAGLLWNGMLTCGLRAQKE